MQIGMKLLNEAALLRATAVRSATIDREVSAVTVHFGRLLVSRIQAKASGRPGPNAPTGNYRRSWNLTIEQSGGTTKATAGTNMPQGRRLEFGFVGPDSLGRVYHQPPYPHAGPALAEVGPEFVTACRAIIRSIR